MRDRVELVRYAIRRGLTEAAAVRRHRAPTLAGVPARLAYALVTLTLCAAAAVTACSPSPARGDGADGGGGRLHRLGRLRPPAGRDRAGLRAARPGRQAGDDGRVPGRPVAVTFVYSTCEDTCPALVDQVRGALDDTGADVPLLAVSVDPANDTPARARRFLNERRMTGPRALPARRRARAAPVWKGYGVQPQAGELEHSATVVLVDARGRQRVGFPHDQLTPEALAHDIRAARDG